LFKKKNGWNEDGKKKRRNEIKVVDKKRFKISVSDIRNLKS
jgi:hypothetical protein